MVRTKATAPRTGSHNYYTFVLNKEGKCGENFYYYKRKQTKKSTKTIEVIENRNELENIFPAALLQN